MAEEQRDELDPGEFPSIEVIYEFVLPSYDWAVRRLDTIERRFDHLLTLTFTLTLAVPVVTIAIAGAESQPNLLHWQGGVALVLFVATAISGIVIRQHGELTFMNIDGMYDELGNLSPHTFKQHVTYYAGVDFVQEHGLSKEQGARVRLGRGTVLRGDSVWPLVGIQRYLFGLGRLPGLVVMMVAGGLGRDGGGV